MTLTFNSILTRVKVNIHAKYQGRWFNGIAVRVYKQTYKHTGPIILCLPLMRNIYDYGQGHYIKGSYMNIYILSCKVTLFKPYLSNLITTILPYHNSSCEIFYPFEFICASTVLCH